ncbi:MAG: DEAD/DEAH box helicase [Bacteroidota bacterium]
MAKRKTKKEKEEKIKKVGRMVKPEGMTLEAWQIQLRRQFAEKQEFILTNNGSHKLYSDFTVINPTSGSSHKVAIRGLEPGENFCTCMDFRTNTLGTCKHIEWTILKLKNTWGTKKYFAAPPPERGYSSVFVHYGNQPSVRIRFGEDNKEEYLDLARDHFDATGVIKENGILRFDSFLKKAKAINSDFRCYDDVMTWILQERAKLTRVAKIQDLERDVNSLDGLIRANLFSYQRKGVLFAAKAGRSLIADEMGLGKTIQAIATAELLKKEMGISRTLIICPTSLKYQWKAEIEKFTDSSVLVLEGNPLKREKIYKTYDSFYLIMTYNIVSRDWEKLNALDADLVILDEAQRIKNWETKISRTVKKLTMPYCIVLTGTPLENKLEELYSIVQFIDPYILSPLFGLLDRHQVKDANGKVVGYRGLNLINKKLKPLMIRRIKRNVIKQMPERQDKVLFVPMTKMQEKIHSEYRDQVAKLVNKWQRFGFLNEKERQRLMIFMNMMRMSCDSTYVIDLQTRHDTKIDELMDILEERLEDPREKVVIFSQWQRMTHLVELELQEKNVGFVHLNGSVPSKNRGELLDTFRDDLDCRVFLSTDAGGVGLNLQSASMVINLDIPWNPAVLEQRIARVYRLGQKSKVQVVNLVSLGTIEHRMLDVLAFKSGLAQGILDDGEDSIFMEDSKFKKFMESVEDLTKAPTEVTEEGEEGEEAEAAIPTVEPEEIEEKLPEDAPRPLPKEDDWKKEGEKEPVESSGGNSGPRKRRLKPGEVPVAPSPAPKAAAPQQLVNMGMQFLGGLAQTLADPAATQELVNSITETDEKTGQSYVKIPVQGTEVVQNVFKALGAFFQQKS